MEAKKKSPVHYLICITEIPVKIYVKIFKSFREIFVSLVGIAEIALFFFLMLDFPFSGLFFWLTVDLGCLFWAIENNFLLKLKTSVRCPGHYDCDRLLLCFLWLLHVTKWDSNSQGNSSLLQTRRLLLPHNSGCYFNIHARTHTCLYMISVELGAWDGLSLWH